MSVDLRAKLMMINAVVFAVYSILWGLAPYESINLPSRFILDISNWPLDNLSMQLDQNTQWITAIAAGLLAAISIFLGGIVVQAIRENNRRVINTTIIAMLVWYLIDSIGSVAAGVASNAFFNSIYLTFVLIPLLYTSKHKLK